MACYLENFDSVLSMAPFREPLCGFEARLRLYLYARRAAWPEARQRHLIASHHMMLSICRSLRPGATKLPGCKGGVFGRP